MTKKELNINVVNCLPYQEPIKKGAIIQDWFFEMKYNKYKRENK